MPIYFKVTDEKGRILIPGSVTIKRFAKWHPAESAQTSRGQPQQGSGRLGQGVTAAKEMWISRRVDNASAKFSEYATTGKNFNAVLHMVAGESSSSYMTVNMDGVVISSYSVRNSGASGDLVPMETLTFNYVEVSIGYTPAASSHTSNVETVIQSFLDDIF